MEKDIELKKFTLDEVSEHDKPDDIWIIYENGVYDVLKYIHEHPGGDEVLLDFAGQNATNAFDDIGHSNDAHKILESFKIGIISDMSTKKKKVTIHREIKETKSYLPIVFGFIFIFVSLLYIIYRKPLSNKF